jgi:anaerobic magnesium-protoporphyrin IX monomethyl ester cyclase
VKVCLATATNPDDVNWVAPLGFGYLKAAAPDHEYTFARTPDEVLAAKPDVLGISAVSQNWPEVEPLAKAAGGAAVVLGGYHITAFPFELPEYIDYGVIGEGEYTWAELLRAIEDCGSGTDIAGLVYHAVNGVQYTGPRGLAHVDDLPMPDRDFGRHPGQRRYIFTSRGCPFKCSFCAPANHWQRARYHSAERVVEEVRSVGDRKIQVWDDLFQANRKRLRRVAAAIGNRYHFNAGIRADIVDDELCQIMKGMGMTRLGMGAEHVVDRLLKQMKGPQASGDKNQAALDAMARHKLDVGAGFIVGHPGETEADIHTLYAWILKNYGQKKLIQHEINVLSPMPGTQVWGWAEERGYPVRDWKRLRHVARYSNAKGARGYWDDRKRDGAIYLNEDNVPESTLEQIVEHYEDRIARGDFGSGAKFGAGIGVRVRRTKKLLGTIKRAAKQRLAARRP